MEILRCIQRESKACGSIVLSHQSLHFYRLFIHYAFDILTYNVAGMWVQQPPRYLGLGVRKPVFGGFANNTGADQAAHPRSLISAFVVRFLSSIICKLATGNILYF